MSTPTLLTFSDAVARVEAAAAGREDFVYNRRVPILHPETEEPLTDRETGEPLMDTNCVYLEEDQTPSCIVGCAFALDIVEVGITPGDQANEDGVASLFTDHLAERFAVTARASRFLQAVQSEQDTQVPWGQAIEVAKRKADERLDDTQAYDGRFW